MRNLIGDARVKGSTGDLNTEIGGLCVDSREIRPGDLFVALKGDRLDGRDFIDDALKRGAAAVLCEDKVDGDLPVPSVIVFDGREALASLSSVFYGRPSEGLFVIGVTGTNGKTTTTHIIRSILQAAGYKVGLMGTVGYEFEGERYTAPHTTPEACVLQRLLREMLKSGCTHVVMEVSSHALAQRRVDGTRFGVGVFTNLTRDHLDYHTDMGSYLKAKSRMFEELLSGPAVINADDPYGREIAGSLGGKVLTYGIEADAGIRATDINCTGTGIDFSIHYGGESRRLHSRLLGSVNVYNILAAAGAALAMGLGWEHIERGVEGLSGVVGRFQRVDLGQDFLCIVDYAHTEDALRRLIMNARGITPGRIITVFGCGGERDRGKRPAMGKAAAELSDLVYVTSDNPRGEDPEMIISEIVAGIWAEHKGRCYIVPDRRQAINQAVQTADAGDTVLIAGKGHENYQEINSVRHLFSDIAVAEEAIRVIVSKGGGRGDYP